MSRILIQQQKKYQNFKHIKEDITERIICTQIIPTYNKIAEDIVIAKWISTQN